LHSDKYDVFFSEPFLDGRRMQNNMARSLGWRRFLLFPALHDQYNRSVGGIAKDFAPSSSFAL